MRKSTAALGSSLFFAAAPGVVAGVVPWLLTDWRSGAAGDPDGWMATPIRAAGGLLLAVSAAVLVHAFARFVREGVGTPAPVAPTGRLVVGGLYRYVRNPMYLAVVGAVAGQALLLWRPVVLGAYAAGLAALFAWFVRWYEQPALRRQFGAEYEAYCAAVPAWRPRTRPYREP
ncbi:methyltransferase family protein [Yinghuangia soli]|uniref:Isoprenylcysteine carboxylmethyltransferase family protein n=1 Tax=Yinghuangia soli TaxID=2908204 RepID=A0AA41U333_9ACTN|nr:isoprenylcysteine carboxylmethyltransferase family protein [Yinghuangia soli]MCF2529292.1 isoprenylcysteine carboxylmethyltransferase family protein [Yinghuangia soli]